MTETNSPAQSVEHPTGDIAATADNWYRGKMLILALALIVYCGGFFLYDGFVGWPARNQNISKVEKQIDATSDRTEKDRLTQERFKLGDPKSSADILLQKIIGFIALPVGFYVLIGSLRKSRGEIRLTGQTLHVPGHPPVPFEAITSMDERLWDRKGISYVSYSLSEGRNGTIRLDDYIYQRKPIDAIHDAIVAYVAPPAPASEELPPKTESPGT
jgi:hypothetical protein